MRTLFDIDVAENIKPSKSTEKEFSYEDFSFDKNGVKEWSEHKGLELSTEDTSSGTAYIINQKIGFIIHPQASSSQELRDLQQTFKNTGKTLYYIYPWDKDSYKLLSHFESKLGLDSRKYAAKRLLVEEVSNDVGNAFMKKYHIQGVANGSGKISIALKEKKTGEILAVQQFSRYRFGITKGAGSISESPVWEGLRLCFKPGVQIHGGASRLQKYFEEKFKPEKIISYINASHSTGQYKASQGFTDITDWNQFSYMWVLQGEPKIVPIIDKNGETRVNDLEQAKKRPYINPTTVAGAFGGGVGGLMYGGRLGSRAQLRAHPENGELVHNDKILEAIGYKKVHTSGQYKWIKILEKNSPDTSLKNDSYNDTL